MTLSPDDIERHARHIMLKEIGGPGVTRLRDASVSIVGAGALGGPCALYLAAAGVGTIEIIDHDVIERSNLQRQVQFAERDINAEKAKTLGARLHAIDPGLSITTTKARFETGTELAGRILIDATDNFATRFALNDLAHSSSRALISGAAIGWAGQVSVFTSGIDASTPCYRCWVPVEPAIVETCEETGVVGAVTGITGARMALEAIKLITGAGRPLIGKIWLFDGLIGEARIAGLRPDPSCPFCKS